MASSCARMTDAVKAQCYAMRHPPKGGKPLSYEFIAQAVKKTDGTHPTEGAVRKLVKMFKEST